MKQARKCQTVEQTGDEIGVLADGQTWCRQEMRQEIKSDAIEWTKRGQNTRELRTDDKILNIFNRDCTGMYT